jgi:ABC-type multidrug transport system ATPase subunit
MGAGMLQCDQAIVERSGQVVVDRLSLAVAAGETLAVIGRTGAGKSSLLAAIATAIPLRGGDILAAGRSVRREPDAARRRIGYVPALPPTCPAVRAGEFLGLFAAAAGLTGREGRAAVERGLTTAGLTGRGDERLDRLPEGLQKLLLVARAVLHAPDVLLLDDPFSGLDPVERRSVERLVDDLRLAGRTVVAAIDDARVPECFTTVAVLHEARLRHHGPADPASLVAGRPWRCRIHCPRRAEAAAAVAAPLAERVEVVDAHVIDCLLVDAATRLGDVVARLVRDGISVNSASLHPSWTEQLVDDRSVADRA